MNKVILSKFHLRGAVCIIIVFIAAIITLTHEEKYTVVSFSNEAGFYNEEFHTVLLDVEDNLALDQVTVYLNKQEYIPVYCSSYGHSDYVRS